MIDKEHCAVCGSTNDLTRRIVIPPDSYVTVCLTCDEAWGRGESQQEYRDRIVPMLDEIVKNAAPTVLTYQELAEALNDRGARTPNGLRFTYSSLYRLMEKWRVRPQDKGIPKASTVPLPVWNAPGVD